MSLSLVDNIDYVGGAGIMQLRELQSALAEAVYQEDWNRVRKLDKSCGIVMDRVIAANKSDDKALIDAFSELKGVYFHILKQAKCEDAAMTY